MKPQRLCGRQILEFVRRHVGILPEKSGHQNWRMASLIWEGIEVALHRRFHYHARRERRGSRNNGICLLIGRTSELIEEAAWNEALVN
jgi:hypothetical protein